MADTVLETNLPFPLLSKGKVREMYEYGSGILMITTDRLSAFDVVLPDPIPNKGTCLNQTSLFWFDYLEDVINNHILVADFEDYPDDLKQYHELKGRSVIVKKVKPLPVECIVRGYLVGSGWKDYQKTGSVCGIKLPEGLQEASKFSEPLFTPSTKAEIGEHDENISFEQLCSKIGEEKAEKVKEISLNLYKKAADFALTKGIIIADTKFELGETDDGEIIWIDEALTPDSSRFWSADKYVVSQKQESFDKQYVRDWLIESGWNKKPPAPHLPEDVIKRTSDKYLEAYKRLTGKDLV